ncbi:MAG: alpha/beta hydrolase [Gemmatimonadetes bacterium]|nr:alpha/beta hydrolase [Gemmatimonadota bacterium]
MAPLPIPAPRESGFTTRTDAPLYWCRYGRAGAPPLVVLHGGPGADHAYLLPQLLDLAGDHDLLFYDQRGGGRSKSDDRTPVTWQTHVGDLAALLGELQPGAPSLLGYSWGGLLAMLYAIECAAGRAGPAPARLALIDHAPISRAWRDQFEAEFSRRQQGAAIAAMRHELAASGLRERDPDAYRQRAFELSVAGYFADPRRATDLTPFRVTGRVQQSVWESLADFDLAPALAALRSRAIVVHGREDPIPLASSTAAARALRAELVVLEDCGHVPYVEARAPLMAALRRFLGSSAAT